MKLCRRGALRPAKHTARPYPGRAGIHAVCSFSALVKSNQRGDETCSDSVDDKARTRRALPISVLQNLIPSVSFTSRGVPRMLPIVSYVTGVLLSTPLEP